MRFRRNAGLAALATAAIAVATLAAGPSGASRSQTVSLSSSTEIDNGQRVVVSWAGFSRSTPEHRGAVLISQCAESPRSIAHDCSSGLLGRSDADGAGTTFLTLATGTLTSIDGTPFTCSAAQACSVLAYEDPNAPLDGPGATKSAKAPVAFARSADDCPLNVARLQGTGAESASKALGAWSTRLCQAPSSIDLAYSQTDSSDGKAAFIGAGGAPRPDYAATSIPFSPEERAQLQKRGLGYRYSPVAISGTVLAFRAFDRSTGQPITKLTLTPSQIAHIFNGSRYSMPVAASDQESQDILDQNPGVSFFGNLLPLGRLDAASSTWDLTSFLLANAPSAWQETPPWVAGRTGHDGHSPLQADYARPTEYLPDGLQQQGVSGLLLNGAAAVGQTLSGRGSFGDSPTTVMIGYMDASTAAFYGLPTVCIQMDPSWRTDGHQCVSADKDSFAAGAAAATPYTDGTYLPSLTPSDPAAWPMTTVSYLITPTGLKDPQRASWLRSLLTYSASDGQRPGTLPEAYAPITQAMVLSVAQAADVIDKDVPFPAAAVPISAASSGGPPIQPLSMGAGMGGLSSGGSSAAAPSAKGEQGLGRIKPVHYAPAGAVLSAHSSPWLLLGLAAFVLAGLLLAPWGRRGARAAEAEEER